MDLSNINNSWLLFQSVINTSLLCFKNNNYTDNWDVKRFGSKDPGFTRNFAAEINRFASQVEKLFESFNLFSDSYSRELFFSYLCYRMVGHTAIKISSDFNVNRAEAIRAYEVICEKNSRDSDFLMSGIGDAKMRHLEFIWNEDRYVIDCFGMGHVLALGQYYYDRNNFRVAPELGDYVVDAGACLGDTACAFSNTVGETGKVYSFDPIESHCKILRHNFDQFDISNCSLFPFALSNVVDLEETNSALKDIPDLFAPGFSLLNNPAIKLPLVTLDHLFERGDIEKVDFLKMDIEGSELNALKGAKNLISRFRPKLAISLYHKSEDLFEIPLFISKEFGFYQFFLDHYTIHSEELVLYCLPFSN